MGNLGGLEAVVILLVALVVLGPKKLPDAARQVGRAVTELKRISGGFQKEMREAFQDPILEAEARAEGARVTAPDSETTVDTATTETASGGVESAEQGAEAPGPDSASEAGPAVSSDTRTSAS